MKTTLFYLVVFLTNIIQGITGFAGTVLAMPPSIMLVGYDTAKPILNLLGILAGLMIMFSDLKEVQWKELKKILPLMLTGIVMGSLVKPVFSANMKVLYVGFGIFILFLAGKGLFFQKTEKETGHLIIDLFLLLISGFIHGLFVSGGPLLVEYVSRKIKDQQKFRVTLSAVWVVLNSIILFDDIRYGYWNQQLVLVCLGVVPIFFAAIAIGGFLSKKMSRRFFLMLTYLLMGFSGIMLIIK